jgi:hypothetical protein
MALLVARRSGIRARPRGCALVWMECRRSRLELVAFQPGGWLHDDCVDDWSADSDARARCVEGSRPRRVTTRLGRNLLVGTRDRRAIPAGVFHDPFRRLSLRALAVPDDVFPDQCWRGGTRNTRGDVHLRGSRSALLGIPPVRVSRPSSGVFSKDALVRPGLLVGLIWRWQQVRQLDLGAVQECRADVFTRFFAGLDNFAVYAVVYAVYFFPWRLVRRPATGATVVSLP